MRVRIRFTKQGDLRLIGHLDLLRCLERVFRRAGLPLGFSKGFHPKPRMSFPSALAVGIEGMNEIVELELAEPFDLDELLRRLSSQAPSGMTFHTVEALPDGHRGRFQSAVYEVTLPAKLCAGLSERIERFMAAEQWPIVRGKNRAPLDLRPLVRELSFDDGALKMRLKASPSGATPGPRDVLAILELAEAEARGARLTRTAVEIVP
jgi:radical SAM-linked protein